MLVRNTYRIEKGLLMRPGKDVFAKNYIEETVNSFKGVWKNHEDRLNLQLKWFYDVLNEYFTIAGKDEFEQKQKLRFKEIVSSNAEAAPVAQKFVPYYRDARKNSSICFDQFYKLTRQRRSVRWYLNKPGERHLIDKAILAANQSPSACNSNLSNSGYLMTFL